MDYNMLYSDYYLRPNIQRDIKGMVRMDRAIFYLKQLLERLIRELSDRKTKTIGDSFYSVQSFLDEISNICNLSGDLTLLDNASKLFRPINQRTIRLDVIRILNEFALIINQYQPIDMIEDHDIIQSRIQRNDGAQIEQQPKIDLSDKSSIFVIMPFDQQFNDVWKGGIQRASEKLGFKPVRVDMINRSSNITDDIVISIEKCNMAIVDVTGNNPNVMFELGYTLAKAKPNIIISQSANFLPFDIRNIRTIVYSNSWSGIEELSNKLQDFLKEYKSQSGTRGSGKK